MMTAGHRSPATSFTWREKVSCAPTFTPSCFSETLLQQRKPSQSVSIEVCDKKMSVESSENHNFVLPKSTSTQHHHHCQSDRRHSTPPIHRKPSKPLELSKPSEPRKAMEDHPCRPTNRRPSEDHFSQLQIHPLALQQFSICPTHL